MRDRRNELPNERFGQQERRTFSITSDCSSPVGSELHVRS
jgi:hypothetical protein